MKLDMEITLDSLPQAPQADYAPIPDGWYDATIGSAEVKQTKAGNGAYISVRYNITGPAHGGRVIFGNVTTRNVNPKAEEIGRQHIGEIMRATGLSKLGDTDQLVGASLKIKVTTSKSAEYGDKNEVKGWRPSGNGAPAPAAAPAKSSKPVPPWVKK